MLSRRYTLTWGIPLILLIMFMVFVSNCGDNGTGSQVSFHPGTFKGTYEIIQHWQSPDEIFKVDTMMFYFIAPDTFRMRHAPEDQEHRFCEANGKYIFGMDSLKVDITTIYPQLCTPGEEPEADYRYLIVSGDIVFKTSDTALYREIVLWTK